jgi:hypothetical protein
MNKNTFFGINHVNDFVGWLVKSLPTLNIRLQINASRFVPGGIAVTCNGFNDVLRHYVWKSTGMQTGDWNEARTRLNALSVKLRAAVDRKDEQATLLACENILAWGGNRDSSVGALPFLRDKVGTSLCRYIANTSACFSLESADTSDLVPPVIRMNAMLTKVHALYAVDGLPIYDSRVAAAIASLVELWRQSRGCHGELPSELAFPATTTTRTVLKLFPGAVHPGVLGYSASTTPQRWSSAKVRLGWIIDRVLKEAENIVLPNQTVSHQERMHAFEASLFMIGYDVRSLDCSNTLPDNQKYSKRFKELSAELNTATYFEKSTFPLFRPGKEIVYTGDVYSVFEITWGAARFSLEAEVIEDLLNHFAQLKDVPLGANVTGTVPSNSLGQWLSDNGWPSRKYASAIAAVLSNEGFLSRSGASKGLNFN